VLLAFAVVGAVGGSIESGTRPGGGTIVAGRIPAAAAVSASPG
jgi:hypothetical protein